MKESVGKINVPINFGGIIVNPGDIVFGDRDGLVVIPKENYKDVLVKAEGIFGNEIQIKKMIQEGKTLL